MMNVLFSLLSIALRPLTIKMDRGKLMSYSLVMLLVLHQMYLVTSSQFQEGAGINGGMACATCTVLVGVLEGLVDVHNRTVTTVIGEFCDFLPGEYNVFCSILVHLWGASIIEKIQRKETPDVVCYSLGICRVDSGLQYCHLYPEPEIGMESAVQKSRLKSKVLPFFHWTLVERLPSACSLPGVQQICNAIKSVLQHLTPALDLDSDKFSIMQTLRGDSWRGKDCDDVNEMIYPGRKPMEGDVIMDSNCNGIHGINPSTGNSYEEDLCDNTDSRGLIYIGDSIGAHFHFPHQWLNPIEMTAAFFKNFSYVLANELDWPHLSFSTGHTNSSWPIINGYTDSLYLRMRQRNLCNHRDYQNICFNGASSGSMYDYLISIARDPLVDKPATVIYAMMGNDVCKRFMSSIDDLITPEEFRRNVMASLDFLNQTLPSGSNVILIGLVNGSFIFPTMANHVHPIGQVHQNVHYSDVYDWFNCMQIGPCFGWMNSNASFRDATEKRAIELTAVLMEIAESENYTAFDLHYLENPLQQVITDWQNDGNELWQLLEPVDSLHPTQKVQPFITRAVWKNLLTNFPQVLGEVNPNNAKIEELFGNQGGH